MQIQIPKMLLEWIDDNRGAMSRQTFIIKCIGEKIKTDPNFLESNNGKEKQEGRNIKC